MPEYWNLTGGKDCTMRTQIRCSDKHCSLNRTKPGPAQGPILRKMLPYKEGGADVVYCSLDLRI